MRQGNDLMIQSTRRQHEPNTGTADTPHLHPVRAPSLERRRVERDLASLLGCRRESRHLLHAANDQVRLCDEASASTRSDSPRVAGPRPAFRPRSTAGLAQASAHRARLPMRCSVSTHHL